MTDSQVSGDNLQIIFDLGANDYFVHAVVFVTDLWGEAKADNDYSYFHQNVNVAVSTSLTDMTKVKGCGGSPFLDKSRLAGLGLSVWPYGGEAWCNHEGRYVVI